MAMRGYVLEDTSDPVNGKSEIYCTGHMREYLMDNRWTTAAASAMSFADVESHFANEHSNRVLLKRARGTCFECGYEVE